MKHARMVTKDSTNDFHHRENIKQVCRPLLIVGVQTNIANVEIYIMTPQKSGNPTTKTKLYQSWAYMNKVLHATTEKDTFSPIFIIALFVLARR